MKYDKTTQSTFQPLHRFHDDISSHSILNKGHHVKILIMFSIFLFSGCTSDKKQWAPEVQNTLKYAVVFKILPDSNGRITEFSVASIHDIETEEKVDFNLSEKFISEARSEFSEGRWAVTYDEYGKIKPRFMFCYYSTAVPDSPIFPERFLKEK